MQHAGAHKKQKQKHHKWRQSDTEKEVFAEWKQPQMLLAYFKQIKKARKKLVRAMLW